MVPVWFRVVTSFRASLKLIDHAFPVIIRLFSQAWQKLAEPRALLGVGQTFTSVRPIKLHKLYMMSNPETSTENCNNVRASEGKFRPAREQSSAFRGRRQPRLFRRGGNKERWRSGCPLSVTAIATSRLQHTDAHRNTPPPNKISTRKHTKYCQKEGMMIITFRVVNALEPVWGLCNKFTWICNNMYKQRVADN